MDKGELALRLEALRQYDHRMHHHHINEVKETVWGFLNGIKNERVMKRQTLKHKAIELIRHDRLINR